MFSYRYFYLNRSFFISDMEKSNIVRINKQQIKYKGLLNFLAYVRGHDLVNARSSLLTTS
jgi:hypothetical protein